jgi:O-antigen/teichoic acid export membrane protein
MKIQSIKEYISWTYRQILNLTKNTVWLIVLSVVVALSQFIVYALINKYLGKEMLGVWSLVVAATSIGQISSFGFSNSMVRYLPEMFLNNKKEEIGKMIGTANFSNYFLTLPILILLYFPAMKYAGNLLNPQQLLNFKSIIPVSMVALFLNNLFSVYSYMIDSMQKYYLRSFVQIAGSIIFLLVSILLLPEYGLLGVALAFLIQNLLQFIIILAMVYKLKVLQYIYPVSFHKKSFQLISSFGLKSQFISILVIFFDPLVKFFITKNMGLAATGNYEISNKIVIQVRNLLVSTNQVIIPKIVLHKNLGTENSYFNEISNKNVLFSVTAGMLNLIVAPFAVYFFSGQKDTNLMQCIIILNIGWVCNMITSVHYYSSIGLDKIGKLIYYHLILSITVVVLYLLLTYYDHKEFSFFIVPSVALFVGSVYNSFVLTKKIKKTFLWLRSVIFWYFVFISVLSLFLYQFKFAIQSYLIIPVFFLLYLCWILLKYKSGNLFKH